MNDLFFSICIPNYNYERYIGETIQSVLDQSYQNFEIIVADNASTDNSVRVVESFKSEKIRLIRNSYNVGFAPNLHRATEKARGDFLILLSSDDMMRPGALECYNEIIRNQGERAEQTVIFSATEVIDENGEVTHIKYKTPGEIRINRVPVERVMDLGLDGSIEVMRGQDVLRRSILERRHPGIFCATAYPRRLWQRVEGYDVTYHSMPDAAFLHKLLVLDTDYIYVHRCLFAFRVHGLNQIAQAAAQAALRQQVDGYMRSINYPSAALDTIGVSREQLIRGFVDKMCITESLRALSFGHWVRALKLLSFAFATYPLIALRLPKTYIAAGLLITGPLGVAVGRTAGWVRRRGRG